MLDAIDMVYFALVKAQDLIASTRSQLEDNAAGRGDELWDGSFTLEAKEMII